MHPSLSLFLSFSKVGAFTFGGGYVMIPIIRKEVVQRHRWVDDGEFTDLLSLAQTAPGAVSINASVFIGYRVDGIRGALWAMLGVVLPSFLVILIVAIYFSSIRSNPIVEAIFKGLRPAVVALIVAPLFSLSKGMGVWRILIAAVAALAAWQLGFSPIYLIIMGGIGGLIYGLNGGGVR